MKTFGFMYWKLLVLTIAQLPHIQATCTSCPSECLCTLTDTACSVDCSRRNLLTVPMFSFSWNISSLNLTSNRLIKLPSSSLYGMSNLTNLYLQNNSIEQIDDGAFHTLKSLKEIDLRDNQLITIPDELLFLPLEQIKLSGNKWMCNCTNARLQSWIRNNLEKIDESSVICNQPSSFSGQKLHEIDLTQCVGSFIWCAGTNFLFFEISNSSISISSACRSWCFSEEYCYAYINQSSCLCAHRDSTAMRAYLTSREWQFCQNECKANTSSFACNRKILTGTLFEAIPTLEFIGVRNYLQREEVEIEVRGEISEIENFLWSFNDSRTHISSENPQAKHKYAAVGKYWVSVTVTSGKGRQTYSVVLVVEEKIEGLQLDCPVQSADGNAVIGYTLKRGTNPVLSLGMKGGPNVIEDEITKPSHYICGSAEFYSASDLQLKIVSSSSTNHPATALQKYVLLFPGYWTVDEGEVYSWELVSNPVTPVIQLQIYRPKCPDGYHLNLPGCVLNNATTPFSTCGSNSCPSSTQSCPHGFQYCYFDRSAQYCRSPLTSCNWFEEVDSLSELRHVETIPFYELVKEYNVSTSEYSQSLYQVFVHEGVMVQSNDVIAIAFNKPTSSPSVYPKLDQFPVECRESNHSQWKQSAMLYAVNANITELRPEGLSYEWFDSIWCDVRLHYVKEAQGTVTLATGDITPGQYTYVATVSNSASNASVECLVNVRSDEIAVSLLYPAPTVIDDETLVYVLRNHPTNFTVQVVGDGGKKAVALAISNEEKELHQQSASICSDGDVSSTDCSKVFKALLQMNETGNSTIEISAKTSLSNASTLVKVVTEEAIEGVQIIPYGISRVVAGTYQEFSSSSTSGTNITAAWIVDGLTQFRFVQTNFDIMFRTESTCQLTVELSNHVSYQTASSTLHVDEMNRFRDLTLSSDSIIERAKNVTLSITVHVDENVDATVEWFVDKSLEYTNQFRQPQTGSRPAAAVEQVTISDTFYYVFLLAGNITIKVTVSNDYDDVQTEKIIEVRSRLTDVGIEPQSPPTNNEEASFEITASPSDQGCNYMIDWGDKTTSDTTASVLSHTYTSAGVYNVTITADNFVSSVTSVIPMSVYSKITGLTVTATGQPTELGYPITVTASVVTGNDTETEYSYDFGNSHSTTSSNWTVTYQYVDTGNYNLSVTAQNPASQESKTIEIEVFEFRIESVQSASICYETGSVAVINVIMPLERSDLFGFNYTFGDGSGIFHVTGNNSVEHKYAAADYYDGAVTTYSFRSGNTESKNFSVCIQDAIIDVSFTSNKSAEKTEVKYPFDYAITGGTDAVSIIDFGDGNVTQRNTSLGTVNHVYQQPGNYTVLLNAQNLVSTMNKTLQLIIQDEIHIIDVHTSSGYGLYVPTGRVVNYTAIYNGTDPTLFKWEFGVDEKYGVMVSYTYDGPDSLNVKLTIENLVSSREHNLVVHFYVPVDGIVINPTPDIVMVNTPVWLNATSSGHDPMFYWKITPSSTSGYEHNSTNPSYSRTFTEAGTYNITMKAENEVSSECSSVLLVVAEEIKDVRIHAYNQSKGCGPVNETMKFEVKLADDSPVSDSTGGNTDFLLYEWKISRNKTDLDSFSNSSEIEYTFTELGDFVIWVNASNTLSSDTHQMSLTMVERIKNVAFHKLDFPDGAAITGQLVRINITVGSGLPIDDYTWKPDKTAKAIENGPDPALFTGVYDQADDYEISVVLDSCLESVEHCYDLKIQDEVQGLSIEHVDPIVPFYVAHNVDTTFRAGVENGTDVSYTWQFINLLTYKKGDPENNTVENYKWNFTEVAPYILTLNASNLVSWESRNTSVYVMEPIEGLSLNVSRKFVPTNETMTVEVSIVSGDAASFSITFGDGTSPLNGSDSDTSFQSSYTYTQAGLYEVVGVAYNNASLMNYTEVICVLDKIMGLDIVGCSPDEYLRSDITYNLSALIESGSAVQYNWSITYSNGSRDFSAGEKWSVQMFIAGEAMLSIVAHNEIHAITKNFSITIQDPPEIDIELLNSGDIYVNDTVEIRIDLISGTSVAYSVDFDDGNVVVNSTSVVHSNVYIDHGVYLINVASSNMVAQDEKSVRVAVNELACSMPALLFVGNGDLQTKFYRSRKVYLETEIDTFGCTAYTVLYRWRVYPQDTCDNPVNPVGLDLKTTINTPLLSLQELTLPIRKYCVQNTATYTGTPLSHTISTVIEIVSTPLAVVISGGTVRYISQSATVVLDASSSFDPDVATADKDVEEPIFYRWQCSARPYNDDSTASTGIATVSGGCFTSQNGERIEIPAANLTVNYEYNFTVTANKTGKADVSTWQSVIIVPDPIPTVTVTCVSCRQQSSLKISSGYHLVLLGSCDSCSRKNDWQYQWQATRRNGSDGPPTPFVLNKVTTTTGSTGRYLVVRVGALSSYCIYEFKLTITDNTQQSSGHSTLILYANTPPSNGNCSMTYEGEQVYVLETVVTFTCTGWKDDDISPLIYTIRAKRYNGLLEVDDFIIYRGTSSRYEAYLPLGFEDNQFNVVIQILVEDQLGTYTVGFNKTLNVQLNRNISTIEWLRNKTSGQLADLQKASDPQVVADFAAGLLTVLNQDSEHPDSSNDEDTVESRKEIRSNITRSIANLTTNSFNEIQQVAAVFKQCMKIPSEFQDTSLHDISIAKLNELTSQMLEFVAVTSQESFLEVTSDLVNVVGYLVDSVNYHVYVTGEANSAVNTTAGDPTLNQDYRKQLVDSLLNTAVLLTDNVLEGKVEGEEPIFLNASGFSSIGGRTTPASMYSAIQNDGCYFQLPDFIFSDLRQNTEMFYIFFVSQQNPYTFGFSSSDLIADVNIANISTRVPSLQFKYPNSSVVVVSNLMSPNQSYDSVAQQPIKLIMAPSERQFLGADSTDDIADLTDSDEYSPRDSVNFTNLVLQSLSSAKLSITNNNQDTNTAVHIMVVFDKIPAYDREENKPYLDVYFGYYPNPGEENCTVCFRLTEEKVGPKADHRNYTIFLDPRTDNVLWPTFYLNVTNYFEYHDVEVGVGVFYSACQYFNTITEQWSSDGLSTSIETLPSVAVCHSDHLTSFGSFVISPPNIVSIDEIASINFAQNPVAIILVSCVFAVYLIAAVISRYLDVRDIKSVSVVPLCGPNLSYKYEVTVKTSPGIGSGTTANVGICVYGYESRTGARHLYKQGAFQRGAVDVFRIASELNLGTIYKIKIWHDNTGLDPGWNVSRIMVNDLQSEAKYYFLPDCWLQVYPDDYDETCLQKTIRAASDEEMTDFSMRFGTQLSYGWEDAHLWLSLLERPTRSSFTRVQRATCCVTLIYMFILLSAFWYQGVDGSEDPGLLQWKDLAVGAIVSVMVFPANLFIVFLFKKSKCKVSPVLTWDNNRAQTAQTVEILDEVLDGRSRKSTVSRMFSFTPHFSMSDQANSIRRFNAKESFNSEMVETSSSILSNKFAPSEDTGIGTNESSTPSQESSQLRRRNTAYTSQFDEDDDFWDPLVNDGSIKEEESINFRPSNLRRTQKAKFGATVSMPDDEPDDIDNRYDDSDEEDDDDVISVKSFPRRHLRSAESMGSEVTVLSATGNFSLSSSSLVYFAYFLCLAVSALSIFFIILYGHEFGVATAERWLFSMFIALLESVLIIEPIKVLFLAIYIAMFTNHPTPEQTDNIVETPLLEPHEDIMKKCKIRPPAGFALEQCKEQAKKSALVQKYMIHFAVQLVLLWSVIGLCMWDRRSTSYWSSWSIKNSIYDATFTRNGTENITFYGIKSDADAWIWLNNVVHPRVINNPSTDSTDNLDLENSNNFNYLLGQVRLRQQRSILEPCVAESSSHWPQLSPGQLCVSPTAFTQDQASYYPGWSSQQSSSSDSLWFHFDSLLNGYGYWGKRLIYDDSGYTVHLNPSTTPEQLATLQNDGWFDRLTRICFVEFTHLNPATHWFTVTVVMFEVLGTGAIEPSHITQTIRLFTPSSNFFVDMLFIAFIGIICLFLWAHEIVKLYRNRRSCRDILRACNFVNIFINLLTTTLCILFVYKEVYMEEVMRAYKSNRASFNNFYGIAVISNVTLYVAGFLLVTLLLKSLRIFQFFRCTAVFGKTLSRCFRLLMTTFVMFMLLLLTFAQTGYLMFGLNATRAVVDFQDFQNSMYSMVRILNGQLDTRDCFDTNPCFTIIFFFAFYFGIFLIFCRLFAAIIIQGYKDVQSDLKYPTKRLSKHEIFNYWLNRVKMRLGIVKPKQFRPTVHFEDMSTHSSESSFISLDSLGTCFTPGRMSQCSDGSGISSPDSGFETPSGQSYSLFDYLTIEHPPFEKPMDDLHLDYLYDRLSFYSVDLLLYQFDKVNKVDDDVLTVESKLLEVTQRLSNKKSLEKESGEIARAVSTTAMPESYRASSEKLKRAVRDDEPPRSPLDVGVKFGFSSEKPPERIKTQHLPFRSSSYVDATTIQKEEASSYRNRSSSHTQATKRPHSDEGVRASNTKSSTVNNIESLMKKKKKTAW